jgi:hypothetical protein
MLLTWVRVEPIIGELRKSFSDPNFLKNLETVATAFADYLGKETHQAFLGRARG